MTPSETAELLGTIQAFDRRTVGEADVMAWHVTLADIDLEPARKAVLAHFTASKDWLMPSDIRNAVIGERRRMVAAIPAVVPPWQLADLPADEQRWVANYRHAIADGLPDNTARAKANYMAGITDDEPRAIEVGEAPSLRGVLDRAERERLDAKRLAEIRREAARREKAEKRETAAREEAEQRKPRDMGHVVGSHQTQDESSDDERDVA